nr:PLP-dependent aminotransferase family protein [uncultured Dethiosulfovibrio sp.]
MIEIPLRRNCPTPLYRQLADHLERMILLGALSPGERLPGSRSFAQSLGVSRMTVVEAYRSLEERSIVVQRGRSGAFVSGVFDVSQDVHDIASPLWSMEGEFPSSYLVPAAELSRIARDVLFREGAEALRDSSLAGLEGLRHSLVLHSASRGIPGDWRDVIVTSGGRQGLVVSFAFLRGIGVSSLLMDRLNYPAAWSLAQAEGLKVVPFDDHDHLMALMENSLEDSAVYLVPSFANPTGMTIDLAKREAILDLSHKKGLWIVEDDAYGELRYGQTSIPAMRSMDDGERLIYLGSFSQALFPGMRLGYSMVPSKAREPFLSSLGQRGGPASSLVQCIARRFISSGGLELALERVRLEMACRMKRLSSELGKKGLPWRYLMPQGGIYLWLSTPGLEGEQVAEVALKDGLSLSPGRSFSLDGSPVEAVRLSVSDIDCTSIPLAVESLSRSVRRYLSCSGGK